MINAKIYEPFAPVLRHIFPLKLWYLSSSHSTLKMQFACNLKCTLPFSSELHLCTCGRGSCSEPEEIQIDKCDFSFSQPATCVVHFSAYEQREHKMEGGRKVEIISASASRLSRRAGRLMAVGSP